MLSFLWGGASSDKATLGWTCYGMWSRSFFCMFRRKREHSYSLSFQFLWFPTIIRNTTARACRWKLWETTRAAQKANCRNERKGCESRRREELVGRRRIWSLNQENWFVRKKARKDGRTNGRKRDREACRAREDASRTSSYGTLRCRGFDMVHMTINKPNQRSSEGF